MSGLVYWVSARYWVLCTRKLKESGVGSCVLGISQVLGLVYKEIDGIRCWVSCIRYQPGIGSCVQGN